MDQSSWLQYKIDLRERLKKFTLTFLKLSESIPNSTRGKVINYQITKSATSMYANYRAALRGRSKAEFYSKLSIVVEEADETEMWLDLLIESEMLITPEVRDIHHESLVLLKILANMRKNIS